MSSSLFARFLCHPGRVGAFCASSRALAVEVSRFTGGSSVVELGPGTGAITRQIISQLPEETKFLAVELDCDMAEHLRAAFPRAIIACGCASNLPEMLAENQMKPADVIVSGLPWAIFPEKLQDEILDGVIAGMAPGGYFSTFAYIQGVMLPAGIRFRRRLESLFSEVETSPIIWRNLPPAFVYHCRK